MFKLFYYLLIILVVTFGFVMPHQSYAINITLCQFENWKGCAECVRPLCEQSRLCWVFCCGGSSQDLDVKDPISSSSHTDDGINSQTPIHSPSDAVSTKVMALSMEGNQIQRDQHIVVGKDMNVTKATHVGCIEGNDNTDTMHLTIKGSAKFGDQIENVLGVKGNNNTQNASLTVAGDLDL